MVAAPYSPSWTTSAFLKTSSMSLLLSSRATRTLFVSFFAPTGEHRFEVVLEGVGLGDERVEDFVFDLDGADGVGGVFLGVTGDADDLVTGVVEFAAGLGDDVQRLEAEGLLGAAGVEAFDAGVGVRRAQDAGMEHPGAVDVEAVRAAAGGLFGSVEALRRECRGGAASWARCSAWVTPLSGHRRRGALPHRAAMAWRIWS